MPEYGPPGAPSFGELPPYGGFPGGFIYNPVSGGSEYFDAFGNQIKPLPAPPAQPGAPPPVGPPPPIAPPPPPPDELPGDIIIPPGENPLEDPPRGAPDPGGIIRQYTYPVTAAFLPTSGRAPAESRARRSRGRLRLGPLDALTLPAPRSLRRSSRGSSTRRVALPRGIEAPLPSRGVPRSAKPVQVLGPFDLLKRVLPKIRPKKIPRPRRRPPEPKRPYRPPRTRPTPERPLPPLPPIYPPSPRPPQRIPTLPRPPVLEPLPPRPLPTSPRPPGDFPTFPVPPSPRPPFPRPGPPPIPEPVKTPERRDRPTPLPSPSPPRPAPTPSPRPRPGRRFRLLPWPLVLPGSRPGVSPIPRGLPLPLTDPQPIVQPLPQPQPVADPVPLPAPPLPGLQPQPSPLTLLNTDALPFPQPQLDPEEDECDACEEARERRREPSNIVATVKAFRRRMSQRSLDNLE
jgi:hypothetical protein